MFLVICCIGLFIFLKFIFTNIKEKRESEQIDNLLLFKILYSKDIYSIRNTNTEDFLVLKTIEDNMDINFIGLFDNTQSVYSLFDRSTNPWKNNYKIVKLSRNNLISDKVSSLDVNAININGRIFMDINKFENSERNFYKSIIEGRISANGISIGEEIYNSIEGDFFYIECD